MTRADIDNYLALLAEKHSSLLHGVNERKSFGYYADVVSGFRLDINDWCLLIYQDTSEREGDNGLEQWFSEVYVEFEISKSCSKDDFETIRTVQNDARLICEDFKKRMLYDCRNMLQIFGLGDGCGKKEVLVFDFARVSGEYENMSGYKMGVRIRQQTQGIGRDYVPTSNNWLS